MGCANPSLAGGRLPPNVAVESIALRIFALEEPVPNAQEAENANHLREFLDEGTTSPYRHNSPSNPLLSWIIHLWFHVKCYHVS